MPLLYPRISVDQPTYTQRIFTSMPSPAYSATNARRVNPTISNENVKELRSPSEAMDDLFRLVTTTLPNARLVVRCNLPTWLSEESADSGLDLYDLRALHARSLLFVHGFIDKLKAAGIQASYKLTVSAATPYTLIRVTSGDPYGPCPQNELDEICSKLKGLLLTAFVQRDRAYVSAVGNIPALIIT